MQAAHLVRIYSDESGESHFDDQVIELPSVNYAPPAPPLNFARDWARRRTADFSEFRLPGEATCRTRARGCSSSAS